ncbi:MAG: hypothetical protein HQM09_08030 [Candidatus Riflebacteria bacterium]|nr:hypothetical protein [Candidatus Riflebacteria bacterium]
MIMREKIILSAGRSWINMVKMAGRRGMTIIFALVVIIGLGIVLGALSFFSTNERLVLEKMINNKKLVYLVRAGLNLAEAKLIEGRWYFPKSEGKLVIDLPTGGRVRVFTDDYVRVKPVDYNGHTVTLLDHIKVCIEASYNKEFLYGYGKFVISPEPNNDLADTTGLNPVHSKSTENGPKPVYTMRKMANLHTLTPDQLDGVPGFSSIEDTLSRKALATYLIVDQMTYAMNYSEMMPLAKGIKLSYVPPATSTFSYNVLRAKLKALDPTSKTPYDLKDPAVQQKLKSQFMLETFKRYFMASDWDIDEAEKNKQLNSLNIIRGEVATKTTDPTIAPAITVAFGAPPESVDDVKSSFSYGNKQTAAESFLQYRGYLSGPKPGESPVFIAKNLSQIHTSNAYGFAWSAELEYENAAGVKWPGDGGTSAVNYVKYDNAFKNTLSWTDPNDASTTVSVKSCPQPPAKKKTEGYSGYYLLNPITNSKMAVFIYLNFFLKFVDENTPNDPIELNSWGNAFSSSFWFVDPTKIKEMTGGQVTGTY